MSLLTGTRVGIYEIIGLLGAGGMGEVYRARDTRLGRDVALKILPDSFANNPERLARFEREARTLASLNHPHIAHIHGLEETESTRALVMELVDGEDLAARLTRGPIPIDEAVPIARQIAEALEAAHELGIIHRDLKPANIKVRLDGTVKVLDFGLAKLGAKGATGAVPAADVLSSPTITSPTAMTMGGVVLGTAAYMAPEQAKGRTVDKRADIWAFGCVLYEMLSGRRAFGGDDVSDTLAFVLTKEVDWEALPPTVPVEIRRLLRRCLQRDPRERLRDIGDLRLQLQDAPAASDSPPAASMYGRRSSRAPWIVTTIAVVAASALGLATWRRPSAPAGSVTRFVIPATSASLSDPVLSPDGSFLVFKSDRLYVRTLSEFEARPLPGTENAQMPFLSPDARWVGFYADGKLKKVAMAGGDPVVICDVDSDSPGAAWGPGHRILFSPGWSDAQLMAVSADGGPVMPVSTLDRGRRERGHWWPQPLPDGRRVLFTIWFAGSGLSESQIGVLDLETGTHRSILAGAMARYAAGHLVFYSAGAYHAVGFDPDTLSILGEPRLVLPDAIGLSPIGTHDKPFTLSESGTVAYRDGELYPEVAVSWVHRSGRKETTPLKFRHHGVSLSPDGTRLAFGRPQGGTSKVAVYDLARQSEQRLQSEGRNLDPVWHPDGKQIAFVSMRKGDFDAYIERGDGAPAEALLTGDPDESVVGWLPGGQRYVVKDWRPDGTSSVFLFDPASKARIPLVAGAFLKGAAKVSPNGRWLAILANPSGNWQLYVKPISAEGGLQPVATGVADGPGAHWSTRTNELVYIRHTSLVAASYEERDGRFLVKNEQIIAEVDASTNLYGVSPDGQRFLIGERVSARSSALSSIRVIVNGLQTLTSGQ